MPKLVPELACRDIAVSLNFYIDVLGFAVSYERPDEGFAYLNLHGAELMLDQIDQGRTFANAPLDLPFGRGVNLQIEVDDVVALYDKAQLSGADIYLVLEKRYYQCGEKKSGNWQFIVCDPDGYMLRFFQDLGEVND